MANVIMKALVNGLAIWISSFLKTAARNGLAILFLAGTSIGWLCAVIYLLNYAEQMRREFKVEMKQEIADARNEYRTEIAALNLRIEACEDERLKLKVRVAQLESKSKR